MRLDRDDALAVLPMRDPAAEVLLAQLPEKDRFATWHLVRRDGSLTGAGVGLVDLLRSLGLTRSAAVLARVPDRALETAYDVVARNRSRLGRLVPDGVAPTRFP